MGLGRVQFEGRVYEYEYAEPTQTAIANTANSLISQNPTMSKVEATALAEAQLRDRVLKKTESKVTELLQKAHSRLQDVKAEVGISQRKSSEVDLSKLGGDLNLKEIKIGSKIENDPTIIPDTEADKVPADLANVLNNELYQRKLAREKGNPKIGDAPDKRTIDLKIPTPFDGLTRSEQFHETAIYLGGVGDAGSQYAQEMSRLNRFGKAFIAGSRELTGFTFITRPRCNLCQANLANVRQFAPLLYCDVGSTNMMIRMLLDTNLASKMQDKYKSDLFDPTNPFLVPACNALQSITGFPDPNLAVETSEGGFFSESQTCAIGYDRLAHGTELQLQFKDYPGGPVMALHQYWLDYMGFLGDGTMAQYNEEIEHNIMGYTVSIYRFIMDPTGRQITRWCKATGCFPKMNPSGSIFNVNQGEHVVQAVREFSLSYWAHHFGHYNDPIILKEFNILVRRYNEGLFNGDVPKDDVPFIARDSINNRAGIPYIIQSNGFNELVWLYTKNHAERDPVTGQVSTLPLTTLQKKTAERLQQNASSVYGG